MRLAFDYQVFHIQSYGGVSRYFAGLAQGLLDSDHQVGIFAPIHRNNHIGAVTVRKDVTFWRRFMPPLPRLLGGLFAGLLMVH